MPWTRPDSICQSLEIGVVVNNAIVLIDYINLLRTRGQPIAEAIEI